MTLESKLGMCLNVSMNRTSLKQRGFTIVELLIVIVIIGILAAITIVAYNGIQERARAAKASSDLSSLAKAIQAARVSQDKTLRQITGESYSYGRTQAVYEQSLDKISSASGANLSGLKAGDPWGNRYFIDENEGQNPVSPCSIKDEIGIYPARPGFTALQQIPFYSCSN